MIMYNRVDTFSELEQALQAYACQESNYPIRLSNILDQLEGLFLEFSYEDDLNIRLKLFFDQFFNKMMKIDTTSYWFSFWEVALLQFIDMYFQKQIEHHGIQIITAKKIMADDEMRENPAYWFNSTPPDQIESPEYYENLRNCQSIWLKVSTIARQKAEDRCFPLPVIS